VGGTKVLLSDEGGKKVALIRSFCRRKSEKAQEIKQQGEKDRLSFIENHLSWRKKKGEKWDWAGQSEALVSSLARKRKGSQDDLKLRPENCELGVGFSRLV